MHYPTLISHMCIRTKKNHQKQSFDKVYVYIALARAMLRSRVLILSSWYWDEMWSGLDSNFMVLIIKA